ncbi:hypothetical protein [Siminovitchia terrae]|uniref:hypothetical protein n=1 Tax=Siminovitchia terrae TaxID=1914933 RepID=UPI0028AD9BEF|nr:hypothetical protein [Siminovitchia terrae]
MNDHPIIKVAKREVSIAKMTQLHRDSPTVNLPVDHAVWLINTVEDQQKEVEQLQSQLYIEPMNKQATLHVEEWEYILAACEQMSCGYERTEHLTHCCDLNEVVPKLREMLGVEVEVDG